MKLPKLSSVTKIILGAMMLAASATLFISAAIDLGTVKPDKRVAAEDVGRRCALDAKRPLNECIAACSAVDSWLDHPCADAAKRTVLGDAGPARMRPYPKVAVVAAELEGGPRK